jgi:hypothetical protein
MIALPSSVTINSVVINGVIQPSFEVGPEIEYSVTYSNANKVAFATIAKLPPIALWRGAEYDAAGQFTDSDVNARLTEVIGADASKFFNDLVSSRVLKKQPASNKSTPIPARSV